jgi:hypothetical protein
MKINILFVIQDSEECKGSTNAVVMRKKSHFYYLYINVIIIYCDGDEVRIYKSIYPTVTEIRFTYKSLIYPTVMEIRFIYKSLYPTVTGMKFICKTFRYIMFFNTFI